MADLVVWCRCPTWTVPVGGRRKRGAGGRGVRCAAGMTGAGPGPRVGFGLGGEDGVAVHVGGGRGGGW